jgi:NADPH:quinone reductase-like Zn-dependent oxidoreductase
MRAITVDSQGAAPALREDLPEPTPADNGIVVRVHASSANPADNSIAGGILAGMGLEHQYPVTLGRDYAGVVEQAGAAVSQYRPGDHVYGFVLHANPIVQDGAWAELITVTEELSIAPAPESVDLAIAGAAPLAGITAMTAIDALHLSADDVLLLAGAAGGVGSLSVQLAARAGARVLAPALPEDEEFLRELGVSDVLPREGDIAQLVRDRIPEGVDALLDLVNYARGIYDAALKPDARVASPSGAAGEGPGRTNVMATPSRETSSASARYSPTGRYASRSKPPTSSRRRRRRSARWPASTPRASSPSALVDSVWNSASSLSDLTADPRAGRPVAWSAARHAAEPGTLALTDRRQRGITPRVAGAAQLR